MSFAQFVLDVGNGTLNGDNDNIIIPERCIIRNNNFVDCVYGEFVRYHHFDKMSSSAILSATNVDVNELNKEVVSLLDSYNKRIYISIDSIDNCNDNGLMVEAILPKFSRSSRSTPS